LFPSIADDITPSTCWRIELQETVQICNHEVKDLIEQHSKKVAYAYAKELNNEDNNEDSDVGTKYDPNCQSLAEIMKMQPPLIE
jgi:hypothetical protein